MTDTNFTHPVMRAIAAEQSVVLVDDIERAIAWLDLHGATQQFRRIGNKVMGVLLGVEFCLTFVTSQQPHDRTQGQHLEAPRAQGSHGIHRSQGRRHQRKVEVARLGRSPQGGPSPLG